MVVEPDSDGLWRPLRRKPRPGSSGAERSCTNRNGRITRFVSIRHSGSALRLSGAPPGDRVLVQGGTAHALKDRGMPAENCRRNPGSSSPRSNHGSEELCHRRCTGIPMRAIARYADSLSSDIALVIRNPLSPARTRQMLCYAGETRSSTWANLLAISI